MVYPPPGSTVYDEVSCDSLDPTPRSLIATAYHEPFAAASSTRSRAA
jgi:hypothetical protein